MRSDYSTNVLGSLAERFIRDTPGPIFVEYAPAAPHTPPSRKLGSREPSLTCRRGGPRGLRRARRLRQAHLYRDPPARSPPACARPWTGFRQNQYRTLLSVDAQVEALVGALRIRAVDDTLIVFTSDNGISWGEHH